jgi:transcriptional regulator with XRE-family HTH domain
MARGRKERELPGGDRPASWLGATLRDWRRRRSLTVTELAVRAGFGPSGRGYVSKIEHGKIERPHEDHLRRIAAALEVDAEELLARVPTIRDGDAASATLATSLELLQRKLDAVGSALGVSGVDARGRRAPAAPLAAGVAPPGSTLDVLQQRLDRLALQAERTERNLVDLRQQLAVLLRALGFRAEADRGEGAARAGAAPAARPAATGTVRPGGADWAHRSVGPMPRRPEPGPLKSR